MVAPHSQYNLPRTNRILRPICYITTPSVAAIHTFVL